MVRDKKLLSAALAALVVTSRLSGQQQAITSVTLADALRLARQVAPAVVQAQGVIRNAQLSERSALWQFIPSLTVQPQMSLSLSNGQSRLDPITQEIISGNSTSPTYQFGASATYTIFDGFARNYNLRQQRANEAAADAGLITSQYGSDFNTTTSFFNALAQRQLVTVAQANLDAADGQLRLASAKLHAGSGQVSDSLTALGNYLQARLGVLQAQSNLVVGESNLGRLVGVATRVSAVDDSAFYRVPPPLDTAAIRQEVLSTAPSLKSLESNVVAARLAYSSSRAGYYPTLAATAAQSWVGLWSSSTPASSNTGLVPHRSLNITLSISPWTSLARETQIARAEVNIANAEVSLADQRNAISAQVNQSYAALATGQEQISVSTAQVDAGVENLRVVTERYRIGVATITEVLTAQNQLVTAQANQVQARYSYLNAKAQLEQILGRRL